MTIVMCPLPNPRRLKSLVLSHNTGMRPDADYRGFMHAFTVASPQAGPLLHAPARPPPLRKGGNTKTVPHVARVGAAAVNRQSQTTPRIFPPLRSGGGLGRGRIA